MTVTCRVVFEFVRGIALTPTRPGNRRWSTAAATILLPVAAFLTVAAMARSNVVTIVPAVGIIPTNAASAPLPAAMPAATFKIVVPTEPGVVSGRTPLQDTRLVLVPDAAVEQGLQIRTILAARAITAKFPQIHNIGGVRPDGMRWHPNGLALDVMIPNPQSPGGKALGDRIAAYVRANAGQLAMNHLIWRQVLYLPNGTVRSMGDRGSDDANHFTHLHIATDGGGFPTGRETYFTSIGGGPAVAGGCRSTSCTSG